jgi:transcriptional regulator with XRE-family HTH domain
MSIDICIRFGQRIKQLRTQKKISQMALCHKIGIEQKYLSSVENGHVEPCLRNIELLAKGLKTPLSEMFKDL